MSAQDLEQLARELLAAEYERGEFFDVAAQIRAHEPLPSDWQDDCIAIRAIVAAFRQQPTPVDLEQFREAVEAYRAAVQDDLYIAPADVDWCVKYANRLLSIIDNAGKVGHQPAPVVDDAMVDRYLTAVHEHLGGLPSEQWDRDREDGGATLRRIARIGLTAALARAQGVQS